MKIILSSASTARKRAMDILGLDYEVVPSGIDEDAFEETDPKELARKLAIAKAREVGERTAEPAIVIGGDMFTVVEGEAFQKPTDLDDARRMLHLLSGKTAQVYSAVSVYNNQTKHSASAVSLCDITFRPLTDWEINDYVSRYPVTTFAAAFDHEGVSRFVETVSGAYSLATGFSVHDLVLLLRGEGIQV